MSLDEKKLKKYCEDVTKKGVLAVNEPEVVIEFLKYLEMQNEFMAKSSAYTVASTMRSYSTWYNNKDKMPVDGRSSSREVYYVDLGAFNLKWEEGYIHPCVVLKRYGSSVLVIPGSTKKYGKSDKLIFDVQAGNGFKENTGLLLDQLRCVSTTRLMGRLGNGKVSEIVFDEILDKVMEKFLGRKYNEYNKLKSENDKLQKQLDKESEERNKLAEENEKLIEELEKYRDIDVTKIEKDA